MDLTSSNIGRSVGQSVGGSSFCVCLSVRWSIYLSVSRRLVYLCMSVSPSFCLFACQLVSQPVIQPVLSKPASQSVCLSACEPVFGCQAVDRLAGLFNLLLVVQVSCHKLVKHECPTQGCLFLHWHDVFFDAKCIH